MKKLIICCDGIYPRCLTPILILTGSTGTWQDSDGGVKEVPTNITRITRALKSQTSDGISQIVYYQSGVGTGGTLNKMIGGRSPPPSPPTPTPTPPPLLTRPTGGTGKGLDENVREAYGFLAHNYHPGDTVHLFGFSRGAYTARSICGLICRIGILTKRGMDDFYQIYLDYRLGHLRDPAYIAALQARDSGSLVTADVPVTSIGCFDTVGSLGIPTLPIPYLGHAISGVLNSDKYSFHDTDLSPRILHAYHALALDESRSPFTPALWQRAASNTTTQLRQCWFPGVHTNIGGGYPNQEISDMTLAWMIQRMEHLLDWDTDYLRSIALNGGNRKEWAEGFIYNSKTGWMRLAGSVKRTPGRYNVDGTDSGERVHVSVRVRRQLVEKWKGGAMRDWEWDDELGGWVLDGKVLKEDWLGDLEKELAGRDVVEKLLGWAFPDEKSPRLNGSTTNGSIMDGCTTDGNCTNGISPK